MTIYAVTHRYSLCGGAEEATNTFHISTANTSTSDVASDLAAPVTALLADLRVQWAEETRWLDVVVRKLGPAAPYPVLESREINVGADGTSTADSLPPQISPVVTLRTVQAGRRFRGRLYSPVVSTSFVTTNGLFTTAGALALAQAWAEYFSAINQIDDMQVVVFSKTGGNITNIVACEVDNVFDTQRRRRSELNGSYQSAAVSL